MSYKKYTFLTLFIYFIAFIAPSFAFTLQQSLMILTVSYIVGAFALIRLYQNQTTLLPFEEEKMAKGRIWILGLVGIFLAIILQNVAMNIEIFFGGSLESENTNEILALVMQQPLVMLAVAIGGPIMEELVFRHHSHWDEYLSCIGEYFSTNNGFTSKIT